MKIPDEAAILLWTIGIVTVGSCAVIFVAWLARLVFS
jgi:hypothetical protein